ncbi:glycosyltransferase involved in cell wall biosynthesis [Roseimicrobium gellanilyticum]|uniref:Glycosyltransferase involved in cell wall biosynthesis n=1 Tax=Roseimicrobium gellanilyticum TaxID=748857 RepID=A0A366HGX3_9BACT|nr:glycosyltransferase family 4 protein [Roseimicrobium gellanilyticum]RBP41320.1 glycosyltransferase involved in cell wall biosynthesis [Roseimicrobium gellanilyticum]
MTSDKQRVLIIVENLPVPLDRRVWQEACALRDAGHDVTVICPQMRGYTQAEEVLDGIQIYRHWISGEAKGIRGFLSEYASALLGEFWCALKAWRRKGFDVIHLCNPPDLLFLVALPFKLFAQVKVVFDVHDLWPEMFEAKFGGKGLLYRAVRFAERCTLALADVVIATNQSVLSTVKQRGRKSDDDVFVVRTAPHKLNTQVAADLTLRKGRKHLVGYIGVMGNADGVNYLIEAASHIVHHRRRNDVQFLLMGSGPEHEELTKLRDSLSLQGFVDMPGRVTNEFLFTALKTMDLGVACDPINDYNDHCTMNKTLEYMAFSRAQVMFGTREGRYSAGDAARYVMENSAEKLGDAILEMIDNPDERERMGALGYERLTNELSWERSVETLLAAYERATSRS